MNINKKRSWVHWRFILFAHNVLYDWREFKSVFVLIGWILTPKHNKDEFHSVFDSNLLLLFYLPKKMKDWYQKRLIKEREIAHRRDIPEFKPLFRGT